MRQYTDLYNTARQAGAKPILLCYIGSNYATRCFGKETPRTEHLDPALNCFEWAARVLAFGDFSQRIASSGELVFLSLTEEEMSSYTLTCDNVDYYFSMLAGKEEFLGGLLHLVQGFDYPGFTYVDFQPLFSGVIEAVLPDPSQCLFRSQQALSPVSPEDPTVDITTTYDLVIPGTVGAASSYPYATLQPIFYTETEWEWIGEFTLDPAGVGTDRELFTIENTGTSQDRLAIGIDTNEKPYLKVCDNVCSGTYTCKRYTSPVGLSSTSRHRLTVSYDPTGQRVIFSDGKGVEWTVYGADPFLTFNRSVGSQGALPGQFQGPFGMALDASNNIYIADPGNNRIQKFNSAMVYQSEITHADLIFPLDVAVDSNGNIWASSTTLNKTLLKFDSSGTLITSFAPFDSTTEPQGVAVDFNGNIWVTHFLWGARKFLPSGTMVLWISQGTESNTLLTSAGGVFVAPDSTVWICDLEEIKQYDAEGNFLSIIIIEDANSAERLYFCYVDAGLVYATAWETTHMRVLVYSLEGERITAYGTAGSGPGQFQNPTGIVRIADELFVCDRLNYRVQILDVDPFKDFDRTDCGTNDQLSLGKTHQGKLGLQQWLDGWRVRNDVSGTATTFPDKIGTISPTIVNGTWTADGSNEQITAESLPEEPIRAEDPIVLPTSSRYSSPGVNQQNVILPLPYGNLIENSDEAVWVCPQVGTLTYCVAGWPVQSVANGNVISVYVDGVLTPSGWTFSESNNFESQGNIATLTFVSDPGGIVSIRCNGKWVSGALLTNPVDIVSDWMDYAATLLGALAWKQNPTSFTQGRAYCDDNSFVAAGVILSNNTLGYWIKIMLASFLGSFTFNTESEVEISFFPTTIEEDVIDTIQEYEAITLESAKLVSNVTNQVITNYAVSYAQVDRRYKNNSLTSFYRTLDELGTSEITGAQAVPLNFEWNRNTASVQAMHTILFTLYGVPPWSLTYTGQDFRFVLIDLLDQMSATVKLIRDEDGNVVENKVYELREKIINLDDWTSQLVLSSIEQFSPPPPGRDVWIELNEVWLETNAVFLEAEL